MKKIITLDHGTGSLLSQELVDFIITTLDCCYIGELEDSAHVDIDISSVAVTTDSFVVTPTFFANGDIGKISVCGTVNDISVTGAKPKFLTLSLIIEEGFSFEELELILDSIKKESIYSGVKIVAGDTKVVGKGEVDQIFINTTGIGIFERPALRMCNVLPGDSIILTGPIGAHTVHLLSMREGLGFERDVVSDCACLNYEIDDVLSSTAAGAIRSIRDVTRGGLTQVLNEYAQQINYEIRVDKKSIPVTKATEMAADMLGLDVMDMANEGCLCLFVAQEHVEKVLGILKKYRQTSFSKVIGSVTSNRGNKVYISDDNIIRHLPQRVGAVLPRLC